ncbi:uncharacterized protein LOC111247436 [Varroa destructor]|uniref:CTCK domain-containing protein n=1 Tax=Varroa destructor TaxID=109461 RepID=A0A7M7JXE5_VARDE|nr:uncharacterized protein LOC111247436 [Varroa destructor]
MEIRIVVILIATVTMVKSSQPNIKKSTHMAFYKWISPRPEEIIRFEPSPDFPAGTLVSPAFQSGSHNKEARTDDNEFVPQSPEEAERYQMYQTFVRQMRNRKARASRRRCTNPPCRRGTSRLLKNLSAKLPNVIKLEDEPKEKEINLLDLLQENEAPSSVLMGRDRVRRNFCLTKAFTQTIQVRGCHPKKIINSFCYGQCNSFFIPTLSGSTNSPVKTCEFCKPLKTHMLKINLVCPSRAEGMHTVHVEKVLSCLCNSAPQEEPNGAIDV